MELEGSKKSFSVTIVDDDKIFCKRIGRILTPVVDRLCICHSGKELLGNAEKKNTDLLLLDLQLQDMNGLTILERIKKNYPEKEVVIITGNSSVDSAVTAIKKGAGNYLCKPINRHDLLLVVESLKEKVLLRRENKLLRKELDDQDTQYGIIGQCPKMQEVLATIRKVGPLVCNVLIQGKTGTGKQMVAKALHQESNRCDKPLITFNCGGFSEDLVTNELFGHEKDAFTGADSRKIGLLEAGNGGTVFLDEIGEMSMTMQTKLLHVIEDKRILRLGAVDPVDLDIRIIAATNRNLREMVQQGEFREDLFFRLNVVNICLPPLVQRRGDLPLLISYFMAKYSRRFNKNINSLSEEALAVLTQYSYPGNVRELENILQRAIALSEDTILTPRQLPLEIQDDIVEPEDEQPPESLEEMEKKHIAKVMTFAGGDRKKAAAILGLPRTTLWRRLKKFQLEE